MTAAQVAYLVGGLATILGAYLAARVAGRSTVNAAKISADEGAFARATEIYEAGSEEQDRRIERINAELASLRTDLSAALEEVRTLRRSVAIYEGRVMQLEATLTANGVTVPVWNLLPADADLLGARSRDVNKPPRTEP